MPLADDRKIDSVVVAALYHEHADELRRFVLGVLKDHDLTADVLQNTFSKMVEAGHAVRQETFKGWLFRVAFHEAMAIRRRQGIDGRALERLSWNSRDGSPSPEEPLCREETIDRVRRALEQLPPEQRQVVSMRIYQQEKFAAIAKELGLPLGTVLTRMKLAVEKLRQRLGGEDLRGEES